MTIAKPALRAVASISPTSVTVPARPLALVSAPALPRGTVLGGRYQLEALVSQGGMGAIYAAQDTRLQRKVAVKMMLGELATRPGFPERFQREARLAASISHPNCVVVHDYGVADHGHYLVLEWVEGRTLEALVAQAGPLPPERAAALLAQVCDGLSAAHAHGFVHRDIKPQNVMVTSTPAGDELVKIVDFGIARALDRYDEPLAWGTGLTMGSTHFMSPEQALGRHVDARSDVYSTGATLYFALSGRPPYQGGDLEVRQQLLNAGLPELPPALSEHPLAAVMQQAMAKARVARPHSAAELGRMIRKAVAGRGPVRSVSGGGVVVPLSCPDPAQPAGAAPITSVKGSAYLTRQATVVDELGEARWNRFLSRWRRRYPDFPEHVLPVTRLAVRPFLEMQEALVDELYGGDSNAFWHIGVRSGEHTLTRGQLAGLFRPDEARRFLLFMPHIYRGYFDGGELASTLEGNVATITITGLPPHLYFEYGILGFVQGGLNALTSNADWPRRVKGFSLGDRVVQYQLLVS